ncbi:MAG TPA: hypothetical protein VMU69_19365 [Bradyrhizobium sp.]|nr:hypothetical protein [Bradyrhizobium sp.]
MRLAKYLSVAASTLFVLSVVPAYAQTTTETTRSYQNTERGYTANPPGPGAPTVNESNVTRRQVEETKRAAEKEIQDRAQVAGADTQVANRDIAAGNQMLAENKLPQAQRFYKAAMSSIENPHSMSMGTHATANNPNVSGTNGMQK